MKRFWGILFALVLVFSLAGIGLASPVLAQPSNVWVDDDFTPATPGWGSTHFDKIQDGIDAVALLGTVHVAAGTYYENITLKDGVQVLGAGADVTTIDGGGTGSVVTAISVGPETVLDGFSITNGAVLTWGGGGGGMYNLNSSPVVTNCLFSSNSALSGGGIYNFDSSPTVTNCTFSNNSATAGWGGGIRNHNSSPTVTNCIFSENSAAGAGGGMYNYASSPVLIDCTFSGNLAERGAGMFNTVSSSPTVTNCTLFGNSTVDTGAAITFSGGGMFNDRDSAPMVTNCTFSNNSAIGYGGGLYNEDGWPVVNNCSFTGNSASSGGGMYNYYASTMVTNCILSNNSATPFGGGGMSNHSSSPTVVNCTFSSNSAAKWGDGMFNFESSPAITNCIFWENGEEIFWFGTPGLSASVTYCNVQGGHSGVSNIDADPMFINPANDYHLQAGSPCCDTGTNEGAPSEDIEGNPRPIDGDIDGTATTDMGAYEYFPTNGGGNGGNGGDDGDGGITVGGAVGQVDKFGLMMPWIIATALVLLAITSLALWMKKKRMG